MKSITATWFEVGLRYLKTQTDGSDKMVTEKFGVDAVSFSDAETRITEEASQCTIGEFKITSEAQANYGEVIFSEDSEDENWFKCKLAFVAINENTGKEKLTNVNFLVQASTVAKALKNVTEAMVGTVSDWKVVGINATKIVDVFSPKLSNN